MQKRFPNPPVCSSISVQELCFPNPRGCVPLGHTQAATPHHGPHTKAGGEKDKNALPVLGKLTKTSGISGIRTSCASQQCWGVSSEGDVTWHCCPCAHSSQLQQHLPGLTGTEPLRGPLVLVTFPSMMKPAVEMLPRVLMGFSAIFLQSTKSLTLKWLTATCTWAAGGKRGVGAPWWDEGVSY